MNANKITTSCLAICLLFSGIYTLSAQSRPQRPKAGSRSYYGRDTSARKSVLTSFPTNFVASTMKVGYEFRVSSNKGLKLIGSYGGGSSSSNSNIFGGPDNTSYYGLNNFSEFGLEAQLRFYILKGRPALNGLYLAPYAGYKSMNYTYNSSNSITGQPITSSYNVSDFSIGYVIGYQYIYNSSFTLDLFVGGGLNTISGNNTFGSLSTDPFAYYKGIMIHPGVGIGIAF